MMEKNVEYFTTRFTKEAETYYTFEDDTPETVRERSRKKLKKLNGELKAASPEIAHAVIDELLDSPKNTVVVWIATLAFALNHREEYATKKLLAIYNDESTRGLGMMAKTILMAYHKISLGGQK